jgi:hypothetical protein
MQHNLAYLEYARVVSEERSRARAASRRVSHPPPQPRVARRQAAALLARLAWRLDREAALRVWP